MVDADLKPKDYSEYVQMDLDDLKVLSRTYEDKISELEKDSISSRVLEKYGIDLKKIFRSILIFSVSLITLFTFIMMYVIFVSPPSASKIMSIFVISILIFLFPVIIMYIITSPDTNYFYKELNKIQGIVKNKESKISDKKININHITIIKLLAKYSDTGINREDICNLMQKEFDKSIDKKTVDVYLKELSSVIQIRNMHYKGKKSHKDFKDIPVYFLK